MRPRSFSSIAFVVISAFGLMGCRGDSRCDGARCACVPCDTLTTSATTLPTPYVIDRDALDAYVPGRYRVTLAEVTFDVAIAPSEAPRTFTYLEPNAELDVCPLNASEPGCRAASLPYVATIEAATAEVSIVNSVVGAAPLFVNGATTESDGHGPSLTVNVTEAGHPAQYVLEIREDGTVAARAGNQTTTPPDAGVYVVVGARVTP